MHNSLLEIQIEDDEEIKRELIQVLWFIPIFMYRFKAYFPSFNSNEFDFMRERVEEELARIFRYP